MPDASTLQSPDNKAITRNRVPMPSYERVAQIYDVLVASQEPVSLQSLCESLDASPATIKRLVRFLRDELNLTIRFDYEHGGYRLERTGDSAQLMGLPLESKGLAALLTAYEVLNQIPPGFFRKEVGGLRERLREVMYARHPRHTEIRERLRVVLPQARRVDDGVFHTVLTCLANRHRVRLDYRSRSRTPETAVLVSPQRLTLYRSNWYLAAWSHTHNHLRVYSVDRISAIEATTLTCHVVAPRTLERHLSSSYGIFEGEPTHVAVLRFSASAARWVADEQWHPDQEVHRLPEGRLELRIPYHDATELKMDILRYGPDVEVVSPKALRRETAAALRQAMTHYRGDTVS